MTEVIKWTLKEHNLSQIRENPKNARKLTKEQEEHIRNSIARFGLAERIIVNTDGEIIGGHQRRRVLKKLGYKAVECWVPDRTLTRAECDELNIRLNKNTGEWDWDILANEWDMQDLVDWGFTAADFDIGMTPEKVPPEEKAEKAEKKHMCPSCGYEF